MAPRPYRKPSQSTAAIVARESYAAVGKRNPVIVGTNNNWSYSLEFSDKRRAVYHHGGDYIIGLRGTSSLSDAFHTWPQIATDAVTRELPVPNSNLLNETNIAKRDEHLYKRLKPKAKSITFTGHSMGADRARNMAAKHKNTFAYGFNSGKNLAQNFMADVTLKPSAVKPVTTDNYQAQAPSRWSPMFGFLNPLFRHSKY